MESHCASSLLSQALIWAEKVHVGKLKRGTQVSFIYHPLAVASLALQYGGDEEMAVAALLHDTVGEGTELQQIREAFGDRVASLVGGFVDPEFTPNPVLAESRESEWLLLRDAYINKVKDLPLENMFLIACEELHELQQINHDLRQYGLVAWKRFDTSREDVIWYFESLVLLVREKLGVHFPHLAQEFDLAQAHLVQTPIAQPSS